MNKLDYTLPEWLNMLVIIEGTLKSSKRSVLSVEWASRPKRKSLGKKKLTKKLKKEKKEAPKSKFITNKGKCFHCNVAEHWKRNCPTYLENLKKAKATGPSEGMLIFESKLTITSSFSWILDSDSSVHICTSIQGLVKSKWLRDEDMVLRVGNGATVAVGTRSQILSLGQRLMLKDCYFVPEATKNLISVSVLA